MRHLFLIAIMAIGLTTAKAQTTSTTVGSDPLSVPTATLPAGSLGIGGSATGGSASGTSTPSSNSSQAPLQLPGETSNKSTQSAATTAASNHSAAPICPPPVPTSDGGSANLSEMVGGSLNGC